MANCGQEGPMRLPLAFLGNKGSEFYSRTKRNSGWEVTGFILLKYSFRYWVRHELERKMGRSREASKSLQ